MKPTDGQSICQEATESDTWRVSSGSAAVLGLRELRMDAVPTTAYLMLGERCSRQCAFCAQARDSRANAEALSRVTWPAFPASQVAAALAREYEREAIRRVCFQVTVSRDHLEKTLHAVRDVARRSRVPICASVMPRHPEDVAALLAAGAERVTIALDAACERIYRQTKSGSWDHIWGLLESCARLFPGHMSTHLIVGLGETECEMAERLQSVADLGVGIGLFAFTPVVGTPLAGRQPPRLEHYRRMQVAHWLVTHRLARAEGFGYDTDGRLRHYGVAAERLCELLVGGEAFRTSGCPGCNRPYYNERPGGVMYNYPRALTEQEAECEVTGVLGSLQ